MSHPCQSPDGGCGAEVESYPTGKTAPDGKPVLQVVDAAPVKGVILQRDSLLSDRVTATKVVEVYTAHHCPKGATKPWA